MYAIDKTDYGLRVVISGLLSVEEIEQFIEDIRDYTVKSEGPFSIFCDVREIVTPPEDIMELFKISQTIVKEKLKRMAMVVASPVVYGLAKQLGFRSGLNDVSRFVSSLKVDNWEEVGLNWVIKGLEPDPGDLGGASQKMQIDQFK